MPSHKNLGAHLDALPISEPPKTDIFGWILSLFLAWLAAIKKYVLENADPRRLIDTDEERQAIETQAVEWFDARARAALVPKFGEVITAAVLGGVEQSLQTGLDLLFKALSATLPPSPAPVTPPATQGSAP